MIRVTEAAKADLRNIDHWTSVNLGAAAAARCTKSILDSIGHLGTFPNLGRTGRVAGTRELVIPRLNFIVIYSIAGLDVVVVRVVHSRMQWPVPEPD